MFWSGWAASSGIRRRRLRVEFEGEVTPRSVFCFETEQPTDTTVQDMAFAAGEEVRYSLLFRRRAENCNKALHISVCASFAFSSASRHQLQYKEDEVTKVIQEVPSLTYSFRISMACSLI